MISGGEKPICTFKHYLHNLFDAFIMLFSLFLVPILYMYSYLLISIFQLIFEYAYPCCSTLKHVL